MQAEKNARYHMWRRLGCYSKQQRYNYAAQFSLRPFDINPMPEDELKAMNNGYTTAVYTDLNSITLAPLPAPKMNMTDTEVQAVYDFWKVPTQTPNTPMKKGKKMYNDYDECECCTSATQTDEQHKRDYLGYRLTEVSNKKYQEARKMFYMDQDQPDTLKELIEKIQTGKFMPLTKDAEKQYAGGIYHIDWHDPAHPADETGYRAARDAFKKLKTETQDQIKIADVADGLKALQALEAWTPTGAAN